MTRAIQQFDRQNTDCGGKPLPHRCSRLSGIAAFAVAIFCAASAAADAPATQDLEAIRTAARDFATKALGPLEAEHARIEANALDTRLRLAPCAQPLETFHAPGSRTSGTTSVGVRCAGPAPWSVYVPVSVRLYSPVLVTVRPIANGAALTPADVRLEERETTTVASYLIDPQAVNGKLAKRSIAAGAIITADLIVAPKIVRRGDKVILFATAPGFEVRMGGEALVDGAAGDMIDVRNLRSRRVVQGRVSASGVVEIPL